ncbi:hypothetical protein [Chryseobacterium scophthalmum]|uniref:Type II toxin-antitoxin system RelE/ParE family toxin n=1 Tax=Chryseobacterium scophthalmum TaxID=59733 RepID=A0A1N6F515_9FLAO|nr:hypothetical protein [Chryseobacterium scophthalmum]SIN90355.1 hypothetical protein SAMN05421769_0995 [Chryseobacterium scophthalmum]
MEREIIFSNDVKVFLTDLVDILYSKNYFGFEEDAKSYVQEIIFYIMNFDFQVNIYETPENFKKFGRKFFKYKANNNTSWYIFFDQKEHKFLINHITNNHSQDFPDLL